MTGTSQFVALVLTRSQFILLLSLFSLTLLPSLSCAASLAASTKSSKNTDGDDIQMSQHLKVKVTQESMKAARLSRLLALALEGEREATQESDQVQEFTEKQVPHPSTSLRSTKSRERQLPERGGQELINGAGPFHLPFHRSGAASLGMLVVVGASCVILVGAMVAIFVEKARKFG